MIKTEQIPIKHYLSSEELLKRIQSLEKDTRVLQRLDCSTKEVKELIFNEFSVEYITKHLSNLKKFGTRHSKSYTHDYESIRHPRLSHHFVMKYRPIYFCEIIRSDP